MSLELCDADSPLRTMCDCRVLALVFPLRVIRFVLRRTITFVRNALLLWHRGELLPRHFPMELPTVDGDGQRFVFHMLLGLLFLILPFIGDLLHPFPRPVFEF